MKLLDIWIHHFLRHNIDCVFACVSKCINYIYWVYPSNMEILKSNITIMCRYILISWIRFFSVFKSKSKSHSNSLKSPSSGWYVCRYFKIWYTYKSILIPNSLMEHIWFSRMFLDIVFVFWHNSLTGKDLFWQWIFSSLNVKRRFRFLRLDVWVGSIFRLNIFSAMRPLFKQINSSDLKLYMNT